MHDNVGYNTALCTLTLSLSSGDLFEKITVTEENGWPCVLDIGQAAVNQSLDDQRNGLGRHQLAGYYECAEWDERPIAWRGNTTTGI